MSGRKVGVADHVTVGAGARPWRPERLMTDVPAGASWVGSPAQPVRDFMKGVAAFAPPLAGCGQVRRRGGMTDETLGAVDIREILRLMPHRLSFAHGRSCYRHHAATSTASVSRIITIMSRISSHFPENPVMPGAVLDDRGHGAARGRPLSAADRSAREAPLGAVPHHR